MPEIVWEIGRVGGPVSKQLANLWNGSWNTSSLHGLLERLCLRSPNSCGKLSNFVSGPAANQLPLAAAQVEPDHLVEHAGLLSHVDDVVEGYLLISGGVLPANALVSYHDHSKSTGVDSREFPFT